MARNLLGKRQGTKQVRDPRYLANGAYDEQLGSVRQVLSNLFRRMLHSLDRADSWDRLMQEYVEDPNNGIPSDRASQSSARWNLQKTILDDFMSWRSFCRSLSFLQLLRFQVILVSWHNDADGKEVMKQTKTPVIDLGRMSVENLESKDEDESNGTSEQPPARD